MIKFIRTFFITALTFIPLWGFCQIDVPKWVNDVGGPNSNCISSGVSVDAQNNVYITGFFSGTADFDPSAAVYNLTAKGQYDTFVAKYTTAGKFIWAVSVGENGGGTTQVNSLTVDKDGNPIIIGQFDGNLDANPGTGTDILTYHGGNDDAFVIKLNTNGGFMWAKSIGGGSTDYGSHVNTDSQGNVIACVRYQSTVNVSGHVFTAGGSTFNGLTIKYDPNGNYIWGIDIDDPNDSEVFTDVDNQDNIVIGGHFQGNDNFNPLGTAYKLNGNGDAQFIAKYTSAGILIWVNSFSGVLTNNNINLCVDSKGEVFADGPFTSTLNFNGTALNTSGSQDLFLAKYSATGDFEYAKDIGGGGASINNYGVQASKDDNVYISGYFSGTVDFDPSPATKASVSFHGQLDFFLAKYDNNLNYKWAFGGGSPNCGQSLGRYTCIDNNNDVLFTGGFCSTVNFSASTCSPYPLTAQSNTRDCFVGKYVQNTATTAAQITAFSVPQESEPAVIDQANLKITVTVPYGTNITALVPTISYSTGVTLSPASGKAENFTSGVTYTLSGACASSLNYTVNVIIANNIVPIPITACSGSINTLTGDTENPVPDGYLWQVMQSGNWISAPGTINSKDYQTPALNNTGSTNIVFSYRRQISLAGIISYDSYYDITVLPVVSNTITPPTTTTFCTSGDPAVITGSIPTGGNGTYTYQWQSSADGTTFTNITGATAQNYDPPVTTSTTYFQRVVTSGTCATPSNGSVVKVTILPAPAVPTNIVQTICAGSTATLTLTDAQTGITYNWYDSAAKTNLVFTGTTYTTGPINANTTYYIEAANGSCTSPALATAQVNVNPLPAAPVVDQTAVQTCSGMQVTLNITSPQTGFTYSWYTTSTGGTAVFTGPTYVINDPIANVSYYAEAVDNTCGSATRTEVDITVIPLPSAPQVQAGGTSVCSGSSTSLNIADPQTGITYNWYDMTTAGTLVFSGTQYNTPVLNTTTSYYIEAVSNLGGCISTTRTTVQVSVTQTPAAPASFTQSICTGTSATLTLADAQTGVTYNWYDSAAKTNLLFTGTSYTTGTINANTTFYVEAVNGMCTSPSMANIQVSVTPLPAAPAVVQSVFQVCSGSQVTLGIQNPDGGFTYQWYSTATGGTSLSTGINFVTPVLASPANYYVEAANDNGCVSPRTQVNINVSPLPDINAQGAAICPGTSTTLTATTTDANASIYWFANATGGTALVKGDFTTPVLNNTTTYYAEASNNATGCPSATRAAAVVAILQQLPAPVVKAGATTASSVTFNWSAVPGATGYLVSTDNGVTYTQPSSGGDGLTDVITGLQQDQRITISVEATGSSSCQLSGSSTAVTAIAEDPKNDVIYVANAFTPNGDGKNDVVYVHSNNIKSLNFYVYDQWGEMLFKSSDQSVGWDGTYKGTRQPVGVYVYYVQAIMNDGQTINKKGTITLLR